MRSENVLSPSEGEPLCSWTSRAETHCLHVNTVDPTEVKIVPGFILSQQIQLGQKQYLDTAADVPKLAREDRPARGTLGMAGLSGDERSWFPRTLEREHKCIVSLDAHLKALIYKCFKLNLHRTHVCHDFFFSFFGGGWYRSFWLLWLFWLRIVWYLCTEMEITGNKRWWVQASE